MNGIAKVDEWNDKKVESKIRLRMFQKIVKRLRQTGEYNCCVVFAEAICGSCDNIPIDIDKARQWYMESSRSCSKPTCQPKARQTQATTLDPYKVLDVGLMIYKHDFDPNTRPADRIGKTKMDYHRNCISKLHNSCSRLRALRNWR